nr:MAG TPA: hypothetical protein [Caudoviricetes sp.]
MPYEYPSDNSTFRLYHHLKASWCKICMAEVQSERNRKNNKKY